MLALLLATGYSAAESNFTSAQSLAEECTAGFTGCLTTTAIIIASVSFVVGLILVFVLYRSSRDKAWAGPMACALLFVLLAPLVFWNQLYALYNRRVYAQLVSDARKVNRKHWMALLNCPLPMSHLRIPGSHDAAAYSFTHSLIPGAPTLFTYRVLYPIVLRWAQCQSGSVYEQLCAGSRYLDFRVVLHEGVVCAEHTLVGLPYTEILPDVKRFMEETEETVIVDFRSFKQMTLESHTKFIAYITSVLGPYITTDVDAPLSRLKKRVLVCYEGGCEGVSPPWLQPLHSPWPSATGIKAILTAADAELAKATSPPPRPWVLQLQVTPDTATIATNPTGSCLLSAMATNNTVIKWLPGKSMNIALFDKVEDPAPFIIAQNSAACAV
jgi:hypothetical protein